MNRGGDTGRHAGGRAAVCPRSPVGPGHTRLLQLQAPAQSQAAAHACGSRGRGAGAPRPDPLTPTSHRLCLPPGSSLGASARSGPAAERRSPRCAAIVAAPGLPHPHLSMFLPSGAAWWSRGSGSLFWPSRVVPCSARGPCCPALVPLTPSPWRAHTVWTGEVKARRRQGKSGRKKPSRSPPPSSSGGSGASSFSPPSPFFFFN